jgi:creatinine amidohydrolase
MSGATELRSHQLELLRPHEIRDALGVRPVVYLPLGTIEWHCEHLPVGLDALTAHGVCLRAASRDGGLVYPPLYYGTGGGHGHYPWTVMMPGDAELAALLEQTLARLQDFGVRLAMLFSGHFADGQLAMIDAIARNWAERAGPMRVFATAVNRIEGLAFGPDHAGLFETTLLAGLHPQCVDLGRLPSLRDAPLADGDVWEAGRHDPKHPLWGVVGPDPRHFEAKVAPVLVDACAAWLADRARQEFAGP